MTKVRQTREKLNDTELPENRIPRLVTEWVATERNKAEGKKIVGT